MLEELDRDERMRLMRFVCSFAWADLEVQSEEKSFVSKMIRRLDLDDDTRAACDALVPSGSVAANFHNTAYWMKTTVPDLPG